MPFTPIAILWMWVKGFIAVAVIVAAALLLRQGYEDAHVTVADPAPRTADRDGGRVERRLRVFRWQPGWNRETAELVLGTLLLAWAAGGGLATKGLLALTLRTGGDEPGHTRGGAVQRIRRPDGTELQVEAYGPADGPLIVLTHGWGANSTEWYYVKKHLGDRFRLVVWDLPGLGRSRRPDHNDYSLEKLARDLDAVLTACGDRPAVLAGHSIGGMITLTFCRLFPDALGGRVAGLALVHTTPTNPVRTTKGAAIYTALEKPVLTPLLHLTIALWPLVWLFNWLNYLNGSAHRSTHRQAFAGTETRGQLDFATRFMPHAPPDVLARGMFGMMHYDATAALGTIGVPTLVVAGDRDITTKREASQWIAQAVPGAELVVLDRARHMGLIEHNDRFDALLADFASTCLRAEVRHA